MESQESRSPLKGKPLRLPGQSVQDALDDLVIDKLIPYFMFVVFLALLTGMEWVAVWRHLPRQPWLYSGMTAIAAIVCSWQYLRAQRHIANLRLGRDGERLVGEYLERLRFDGGHVFHDVPGEHFNLDHVLLTTRGFFVVETKTRSKPRRGKAVVTMQGDSVLVAGFKPDRDPVQQVQSNARWLAQLLSQRTGKNVPVRGVILFPGWRVEKMSAVWRASALPWVLSPRPCESFFSTNRTESQAKT